MLIFRFVWIQIPGTTINWNELCVLYMFIIVWIFVERKNTDFNCTGKSLEKFSIEHTTENNLFRQWLTKIKILVSVDIVSIEYRIDLQLNECGWCEHHVCLLFLLLCLSCSSKCCQLSSFCLNIFRVVMYTAIIFCILLFVTWDHWRNFPLVKVAFVGFLFYFNWMTLIINFIYANEQCLSHC